MFDLCRYFSRVSLLLMVLAAGILGPLYRHLSLGEMTSLAEGRNVALAQAFRNSLGPGFDDWLGRSDGLDAERLRADPETRKLRGRVEAMMQGTAVVKVKVYNRRGTTVLSTDAGPIGEDQAGHPGFAGAMAGAVVSELTRGNRFDSAEGIGTEADLLASYVPVAGGAGVFELYQDVTPALAQVNRRLAWVAGGGPAVLGFLYLVQYLVVRRAHRILQEQEAKIEAVRATLELQVEQRTAELTYANRHLAAEVSERRRAEGRLQELAFSDPLTGLANRRCFMERLERSIDWAGPKGIGLAILFIDLDHFQQVTGSLGHRAGDRLLAAVAERLGARARATDFLARLGGDEFIYLMEAIEGEGEVARMAKALLASLDAPFDAGGQEIYLTASVGISLFPGDAGNVETLLRNADTAMYRAKQLGRGQYHFYAPEMTRDAQDRMRLEGLLRRAIGGPELVLHYQQQVDARSGRLIGAEALLRWQRPELGSISPQRFIGLAEESGLIVPLGSWVLWESCRQLAEWYASGFDLPHLSVNLSVRQLQQPQFVANLTAILAEFHVDPRRLKLEITESVVMAMDDAASLLERLRALGVGLAIDDFGTGYSSLAYLRQLPIQQLKIDRAFVEGIGTNPGDEAIVRTILALARSLGLEVVAEGVENRRQANFLAHTGCNLLQGYYHGQPAAAGEFRSRWEAGERLQAAGPLRA